MWLIPSRSRPHNVERLVTACADVRTPAVVRLDNDDPMLGAYPCLSRGWRYLKGRRKPLAAVYNELFGEWPELAWYGFLADDVVPLTPGWDTCLIEAAGADGMAVPSGGETTGGCPHFVLGGDLVRSVGWLGLPGLSRLYIDTVWGDIAKARGVYREVPDVILEHRHFSNGKALMDATYRKPGREADRAVYEAWKAGKETTWHSA